MTHQSKIKNMGKTCNGKYCLVTLFEWTYQGRGFNSSTDSEVRITFIARGGGGNSEVRITFIAQGGGYFLVTGLWGCAAGWGRIFTTGLTIMGLHFQ